MAYQSKHTGAAIDAAIDAVATKEKQWDEKQDKLTGNAGQLVIFDENGNPIAQDMPDIDVDTDNLITLEGGGEIDMAEAFGEGPYVISFTPDEGGNPSSGSGIAIGPDEPTDADMWVDTDDDDGEYGVVMSFKGRDGDVEPQDGDYTAEMVGAISAGDKAVPNGVATLDANGKLLDAQIPGLDKLGAAPAGFGLGNTDIAVVDPDTTTAFGVYKFSNTLGNCSLLVIPRASWGRIDQYAHPDIVTTGVYHRRSMDGGNTWSEWDCDNPPMLEGTEYRTTERFKGKAVYALTFNVGALPSADTTMFPLPISGGVYQYIGSPIVNLSNDVSFTGVGFNLVQSAPGAHIWAYAQGNYIYITTDYADNLTATITVKYTKYE